MTYTNSIRPAPLENAAGRRFDRLARTPRRGRRARPVFARRPPRPSRIVRLVCALALACILGLVAWWTVEAFEKLTTGAQGAPVNEPAGPRSTPKEQWHAGEVPELYQRDPSWASERYAGDAFGESGCGPTCLSMVYIALTGHDDRTPADMGALSEALGCATPDGTAWTFMTEGAAEAGLVAEELPANEASVRGAILSGSPVIASVGPGDFTTTGHFIVLAGIDERGQLVVRDPNSPERTARTWKFDEVLSQCLNLWAYTAA
ncbi:hypothetical protein B5F40_03450 [Gordonibacter sp. An230]|uniref:C39 family peptidase n=1 Tax=Gordonibacter sp. An230 TaxID=1965592 RepID=UPI000B384EE5|nr:C39 family peptidase [Gordonibacter sp. An230]OUO91502.1 hypothetical protein B5F40_03450 [Gordonibacter sp. An230]